MNQLTRQEWDALSAYLDNALKQRERQRLESQLQARPELRAALNELRQTRQLLRQTPALRVPRNFTLTPEMAGGRVARPRTYPLFRLAFVLASILFVMVIGGEVLFGDPAAVSVNDLAMVSQAESMAAEEAPAEAPMTMESAQVENGTAERAMDTTPAEDSGGEIVSMAPPLEETPTPEFSFSVAESPTLPPEAMTKNAPETETVAEEALPQEESVAETPLPQVEFETQIAVGEPAPEPSWWVRLFGSFTPWRLLQIIFGGAVILSGVGLLVLKRRN